MEPVYDVGSSYDGKGQIISSTEGIGQNVFVCDSKSGRIINTTIRAACNDNYSKNRAEIRSTKDHQGKIELPQDWIGKQVHIRPFVIVSA